MKTISETEVAYRKALEKVLEDSKCGVVPKSHIEAIEDLLGANQKEDKNDWHERGELPPVGTVCRRRFATTGDVVVTITYVGDGVLCYRNEKGVEYTAVSAHIELRPIQTERGRWVEAARKAVIEAGPYMDAIGSIYDAGLAKIPEDK